MKGEAELYMTGPDGITLRYFGSAIGKNVQSAKTEIEKRKMTERTCRDNLKDMAKILHLTHDENKDKDFELEMGWICEESGWQFQRVPLDLRDQANREAREEIEDEEGEDSSSDDEDDDEDE